MDKFITQAEADLMRAQFIPSEIVFKHFREGLIGVRKGDDYYVVPDNDPRLHSHVEIPDTESPT